MLLPHTDTSPADAVVLKLYEEARDDVYYYVLTFGMQAEQAQDITQEVFLKLFMQLRSGEEIRNPRAWAFRVAHNEALKTKTRTRPHVEIAPGWEPEDPNPGVEAGLVAEDSRRRLEEAIANLSSQQRQVLHLRAEGLKLKEIAETIGIGTSTVNEFLRRAVVRLKKALDA